MDHDKGSYAANNKGGSAVTPERGVHVNPGSALSSFLSDSGPGRRVSVGPKQAVFSQGEAAEFVFFIHTGHIKLTVISHAGREATIMLFGAGDLAGEDSLTAVTARRLATATTLTWCTVSKIDKTELLHAVHENDVFCDLFVSFLVARTVQTQANLVDQLFNSSEKRLARVLLLMADFGNCNESEVVLPKIFQEALAEMVGTNRSRVNYFMNRFRAHGFVTYDSRIRVHRSLSTLFVQGYSGKSSSQGLVKRSIKTFRT